MGVVTRAVAVAACGIAILAACTQPPVERGVDRFYSQQLSWGPCTPPAEPGTVRRGFTYGVDCARLEVPLDYGAPAGRTAQIAIMRRPASGQRIGSLVVNPGGPGYSGADGIGNGFAMDNPITERFDLIGFDPRGVGASTPAIDCLTAAEWAVELADLDLDTSPDGAARTEAENQAFAQRCAERSGTDLLANVGTRDVVKDLDVLRAVLGEEKLSYIGFSYGAFIGERYAAAFPGNVRAMVFDNAYLPHIRLQGSSSVLLGAQAAFDAYATDCVGRPGCPLGSDRAQAQTVFQTMLRGLIDRPVPVSTRASEPLRYREAQIAVRELLLDSIMWPVLTAGLTELAGGDGRILESVSAREIRGLDARTAVECADGPRITNREAVVGVLGHMYGNNPFAYAGLDPVPALDICAFWPTPRTGTDTTQPIAGLPRILVVAETGDAAPPFRSAGAMLAEVLGATLVTVQGNQRSATFRNVPCVDDVVSRYLIDLVLPAGPPTCVIPGN